ncbi:MAG: LysR family transcriptional regulator [Pseudomonadales bacterium]|nr:LysR family transcriptional regulator [Pseudomonadales bacterium]
MDTELLRTFLEVEKTRHFGRAAENLYLTQAAVSSRIRQLESTLGVSLFHRYRNNINLTPAGERLKPHAEAVMISLSRAMQESSLGSGQSLQIAIGGPPNLWDSLLQVYLNKLVQQFTGITLRAVAQDQESLTRQLVSHTLDIALMFDPPKVNELKVDKIQSLQLILVTTFKQIDFTDVFQRAYIQVDWGTSFNIQHAQYVSHTAPPIMHTSTGRIALDFMLKNGGSAFLPAPFAQAYIDEGKLHPISQISPIHRDVYTAYHHGSEKQDELEKIIALFAQTDNGSPD